MGRPAKPWWWAARGRWAATIGGVRVTAPPEIGERDTHAAWQWHERASSTVAHETRPRSMSFAELCEAYLAWDADRVAADQRSSEGHRTLAVKLTTACGTVVNGRKAAVIPIADWRHHTAEALERAWRARGLSPNTRRVMMGAVILVFRWGVSPIGDTRPILDRSPMLGYKLPPVPESPERHATRTEAAAWLRWLWRRGHRELAQLQRVLIYTGARPRELLTARWGQVQWRAQRGTSGHWMATITLERWKAARKTGRLRRIYLPARIVRSLLRRSGDPGGLIWTTPRGVEWSTSNLASVLATKRRQAMADGVPILDTGPNRLTNYRWRHSAATELIQAGVDIATVAELLGTSPHQIQRTYAHLLQGHLGAAAERLAQRRPGK